MNSFEEVRAILGRRTLAPQDSRSGAPQPGEIEAWRSLWSFVAARLLAWLESGRLADFGEAVPVVGEALDMCTPAGRQVAVRVLFGDFTRRAIAAGVDRTRFLEWLRPARLFAASNGRVRGRVLYFNDAKGRGKILGSDGVVYFVVFFTIAGPGFRSVEGGQLVEFVPQFGLINGQSGVMATDVKKLGESDALDADAGTG